MTTTKFDIREIAKAEKPGEKLLLSVIAETFKENNLDDFIEKSKENNNKVEVFLQINGKDADISFLAQRIEENMLRYANERAEELLKEKFHDLVMNINDLGSILQNEVNKRFNKYSDD